jgi:predicted DNA-binding transcriptional regulator AlpA
MSAATVEEMYDLHAVAKFLAIDERTVWRRVSEGKLAKPVKLGRAARWFASDLASYQQRLRDERGE